MPYLGSTPNASFSSRTKQDFTANGSTTAFTLSSAVASPNDIEVFVGNVRQEPTDAYTVNGTTLTMSEAPATGINFYVVFKGVEENSVVPADNTISSAKIATDAVSTAKIANNAVTTAKIQSGAIDGSLLNENAFMIDTWYHTADIVSSAASFLVGSSDSSDWTNQTSNTNRGSSRMSESSGVFTFPSTGIYRIVFSGTFYADGSDTNLRLDILTTTDNSTYIDAVRQSVFQTAAQQNSSIQCHYVFDVTNTTTHKVQFSMDSATNATIRGGQEPMMTYVIFERLGNT